jgi:hypothetical protein
MDCLVCRCDTWQTAAQAARRAFELADLDTDDAKYYVWLRGGTLSDDEVWDGTPKSRDLKGGYKIQPGDKAKRRKPPRYVRAEESWTCFTLLRIWLRDIIRHGGRPLLQTRGYNDPRIMPDPACFAAAREHRDPLLGTSRRLENYMTPGQFADEPLPHWKLQQATSTDTDDRQ